MGSESISNNMKFPPLRLAELMPNLMALVDPADSPDNSYTSGEESGNSPQPSPRPHHQPAHVPNNPAKSLDATCSDDEPRSYLQPYPRPRALSAHVRAAPHDAREPESWRVSRACESTHQKYTNEDKENDPSVNSERDVPPKIDTVANASSSCTYPGRGCGDVSCPSLPRLPASEVKRRNILPARNQGHYTSMKPIKSSTPRAKTMKTTGTPIMKRLQASTSALKISTPVMKPGIKRFTPGSSGRSMRRSLKKEAIKKSTTTNKDSARCLFPEPQRRPFDPPHAAAADQPAVPATPSHPSTVAVASTPSYPNTNSSKITLKTMVIKGKSYIRIKKLGTGGSSEVFKVLEVGGECGEYAVKCVNMAVERNLSQSYINEIRLLRELQSSDRVIQLYAYEYDKSSQLLKVVLEVGETDLSSFLKARQATGLPPELILYYWKEMLHAVNHIHQHGVVHADLKPANFLLVCGRLKLIDFGIATAISTDATSVERPCAAGTFSYISPEALMGGAGRYETGNNKEEAPIKISFKSDVWSLGCILYSMVHSCPPFGHIAHVYAKIAAIVDPKHVINYPAAEHMPPNLTAAMKWCLTYNAKSRPSVQQLLSIDYLTRN